MSLNQYQYFSKLRYKNAKRNNAKISDRRIGTLRRVACISREAGTRAARLILNSGGNIHEREP